MVFLILDKSDSFPILERYIFNDHAVSERLESLLLFYAFLEGQQESRDALKVVLGDIRRLSRLLNNNSPTIDRISLIRRSASVGDILSRIASFPSTLSHLRANRSRFVINTPGISRSRRHDWPWLTHIPTLHGWHWRQFQSTHRCLGRKRQS